MWRNQKSKLYLSWLLTVPLLIMLINIWSLVHVITNMTGAKLYLMNCIFNLMQFVVSNITFYTSSTNLACLFVSQVVLSFGMCLVVIIEYGITFKQSFLLMYKYLKITYWVLSKGSNKGNTCKNCQLLLK